MTKSQRKIRISHIAHVYYKYADLDAARLFFLAFGFCEIARVTNHIEIQQADERDRNKIYFRGYGVEPFILCAIQSGNKEKNEFGGAAFAVETEDDLFLAAATIPGASEVHDLHDAPGDGRRVTFPDPVDGYPMHLVYGQKKVPMMNPSLPHEAVNYPTEKNRPANKTQRFTKGPAPIHKLGHFGVRTTNYAKAYQFYTSRFNFLASDIVHDADGIDRTVFLRLDRGKEAVDHHVFFFAEGPKHKVHHSSFETHDFDTQVLGHDWLREKGYRNCWGIGRHVMGSQIFDYWYDPNGFIFEHYVDGDLANSDEPTHRSRVGPGGLHVWGPEVPKAFLE